MATLTIRGLDDQVKADLRLRAARNGRSMEAEAREILARAVAPASRTGLGTRLRERFRGLDPDLDIPPRTDRGRPIPDLAERADAAQ
ncbi:MAG: plasmid stabilization protein [Micropruina sp.]|uniref:FitA-like ribbon-helix-helix domain-containing protein n=1 Tax=Micropruina sp. TaxID=2737536 RepID=UPI0039E54166